MAKDTDIATKLFECKYFSGLPRLAPDPMIESEDSCAVEVVMRLADVKHFLSGLLRIPRATERVGVAGGPAPLDFDPFWHGDHWQNLLASPMDARHYVMEDWAVPASDALDERRDVSSHDRRNGRRAA